MEKFIIWGAGVLGEYLCNCLGKDRIIAFIDNNKLRIGEKYCDKAIISFDEYKNNYSDYFIIISPRNYKEIEDILKENRIYQYFILDECPHEIPYNNKKIQLREFLSDEIKENQYIAIYGVTLFSVLLYELLINEKNKKIFFILDKKEKEKLKIFLQKKNDKYKFISLEDAEVNADMILVTVRKSDSDIWGNNTKNLVKDFYDFSHQFKKYSNPRIEQFRDLHFGKRCFIVATGPSLNMEDLECLRRNKEICISMNMIFRAFLKTNWRPDYFVVEDPHGLQLFGDEFVKLDIKNKFISDLYSPFWNKKNPHNIYKYHISLERYKPDMPKFSDDFTKGIYCGFTVVYSCLQIASYMGFKEIYLIGTDFEFKENRIEDNNHFVKDYYGSQKQLVRNAYYHTDEILLAYQKAYEYAEEHDIKIYNATRGGKLEIFERVNFDSLFR
jgi:hypothetical protein